MEVRLGDQGVVLEDGQELDSESFLAFLTERPQHLTDPQKRQRVEGLLPGGR